MARTGMWPTPRRTMIVAQDAEWTANGRRLNRTGTDNYGPNLAEAVGGQLNPTWVEWLMGFPTGWTDLEH
jgi:hypothetical protein